MKMVKPNDVRCSTLLNFRRDLSKSLFETHGTSKQRDHVRPMVISIDARYDGNNHWINFIPNQRRCSQEIQLYLFKVRPTTTS